ncbi:hypothetical protein BaRGS_00018348 [Batillaria attramentaria]|uniref:Uncharacterized protein n=1 Tax=Batillaria attramentaria TaxID=370345 RepID=A0ABD0KT15_9CAEN
MALHPSSDRDYQTPCPALVPQVVGAIRVDTNAAIVGKRVGNGYPSQYSGKCQPCAENTSSVSHMHACVVDKPMFLVLLGLLPAQSYLGLPSGFHECMLLTKCRFTNVVVLFIPRSLFSVFVR